MPNPVLTPALYNYVKLAGIPSPGVCKITGASRPEKWEVTEADGESGASTTNKGSSPAKFTLEIYLWHEPTQPGGDMFEAYEKFRALYNLTRGEKARALDIYHPDLEALGIKSVVIGNEGQLEHDGKGGAWVKSTFIEYLKPKPKKAKPIDGSLDKKKKDEEPDPNADLKKQLEEQLKKFEEAPSSNEQMDKLLGGLNSVFEIDP